MTAWLTQSLDRAGLFGFTVLLQSALLATVALCLIAAYRRRPAVRHFTALTALFAVAACPLLQLAPTGDWRLLRLNLWAAPSDRDGIALRLDDSPPSSARIVHESQASDPAAPSGEPRRDDHFVREDFLASNAPEVVSAPQDRRPTPELAVETRSSTLPDAVEAPSAARPTTRRDVVADLAAARAVDASAVGKRFLRWATVLWMLGGLALAARFLERRRGLQRAVSGCRKTSNGQFSRILADVVRDLRMDSAPDLLLSDAIPSPIVTGIVHPKVILPASQAHNWSIAELRIVLIHECSHVARRDLWFCLFQRFVAIVFWPNLLVHFLNRQLCLAREELCDNHVLAGTRAVDYVKLLLGASEQAASAPTYAASLSWVSKGWSLEKRVAGLLAPSRSNETSAKDWTRWLSLGAVLATSVLATGIAIAEGPAPRPDDDPARVSQSTDGDPIDPAQVIEALQERSAYWVAPASADLATLEYTFELNNRSPRRVMLEQGEPGPRYGAWQGCCLRTGFHALVREPDRFDIEVTEGADEGTLRVTAKVNDSDNPISIEVGNGVVNSWTGYYLHRASQIELIVDRERLVPLEERSGPSNVRFLDWRQIGDNRWAPGVVDVMKDDVRYRMHFQWMGDAVWLLTHGEILSRGDRRTVALTRDVVVNGEAVVAAPTRETTVQQAGDSAAKAVFERMLSHNRAWLDPGLNGVESLEYSFHTVREDVREQAYVNDEGVAVFEATHDGQGKMGDRVGDRRMALADHSTASTRRDARFAKFTPRPAEPEGQPYDEQLRRYAQIGCQLDMPLFRHQDWIDHAQIAVEKGEWQGRPCDVLRVSDLGRDVYFGAGTMLAFTSWSYVHHIRPDHGVIYIDPQTNLPFHETLVSDRGNRNFEVDFSDWVEVEPGAWAPLAIDIEAKDYFNVQYRFQIVGGTHWMLKEVTSWFDPTNKSRGVVEDVRLNQPSELGASASQQVAASRQLFGDGPEQRTLNVGAQPIVFGQRTTVGPYEVMLTIAGPWDAALKVVTRDENAVSELPVVLLDEDDQPLFAANVTLRPDGDAKRGEAELGYSRALGGIRSIVIPHMSRGTNSEHEISVTPGRWNESINVNIAGRDPSAPTSGTRTRAYRFELSVDGDGAAQAKLSVASQAGPAEFLLDLSVALFDEQGRLVAAGLRNEKLRVERGVVEAEYVIDIRPAVEPSQVEWVAIAVTPGDWVSAPMGSTWGMFLRQGPSIPLEQLLAADDDACRELGLHQLDRQLELDDEFFNGSPRRDRLRERGQGREQLLQPYVNQLVRIVQEAEDGAILAGALRLLGHAGDRRQLEVVRGKTSHSDKQVVDSASVAAAMLGSAETLDRLEEILQRSEPSADDDRDVRLLHDRLELDALIALATVADERAVDLLGETLQQDLRSLSVGVDDRGRKRLEGGHVRAERIASLLGLAQRETAAGWLLDAARFLVDHPELGELFDKGSLASSLAHHEAATRDFFVSRVKRGDYYYLRALDANVQDDPEYIAAIREALLAPSNTAGSAYQGIIYLWNVGSPEALEVLREAYSEDVLRDDARTRLTLCRALAALGDDRGLRDAFDALAESFSTDGMPIDEGDKKAWRDRKEDLADWTADILERVSQPAIREFAMAHIDVDEPGERRALVELLWRLPDTPESILPKLQSWQPAADAALQENLTKLLSREEVDRQR